MNVVVSIGGEREAVPVRAIPFLTDLDAGLQPIVLAKIFAEEDHDPPQSRTSTATKRRRLPELQAFRLESGAAKPISVRAWSMYSADLHQMEGMALDLADREWLIKATSLLPPGVFVWKDEFEESYERTFGEGGTMVWNGPEADLSLDFSPLIPSDLQVLVMEGFDSRKIPSASTLTGKASPLTDEQKKEIGRRLANGETQEALAGEYRVSRPTIAKYRQKPQAVEAAKPWPAVKSTKHRIK